LERKREAEEYIKVVVVVVVVAEVGLNRVKTLRSEGETRGTFVRERWL
jgi:hypothetical protein